MKHKLAGIFSWVGVIFILGAYIGVSFQLIAASSLTYLLLNLVGALGVGIEAYVKKDNQSGFLNVAWALIALIALAKVYL